MPDPKPPLLRIQVHNGFAEYFAPEKIQRAYLSPNLVHVPGQQMPSPTGPLITYLKMGTLAVPVDASLPDIVSAARLEESCVKLSTPAGGEIWVRADTVERVFAASAEDAPNTKAVLFFGPSNQQAVREDVDTVRTMIDAKRRGNQMLSALAETVGKPPRKPSPKKTG